MKTKPTFNTVELLEQIVAKQKDVTKTPPVYNMVECHECGELNDASNCEVRTIDVPTGKSGGSFTLGKRGKSNVILYHTGRTYYKKQNVFVCRNCVELEIKRDKQLNMIIILMAVIFIATLFLNSHFHFF